MPNEPVQQTTPRRQRRSGACDPRPLCAACEVTLVAKEGTRFCAECQAEKDERDEMDHQQYLYTVSA